MSLKCVFGHKWNGCKCERCGALRDGGHKWNGCKCEICGKIRDEGHKPIGSYRCLDSEMCVAFCSICHTEIKVKHDWNDICACRRCGVIKESASPFTYVHENEHDWEGCKCKRCGKTRNKEHLQWESEPNNPCKQKCKVCGETQTIHKFENGICTVCGQKKIPSINEIISEINILAERQSGSDIKRIKEIRDLVYEVQGIEGLRNITDKISDENGHYGTGYLIIRLWGNDGKDYWHSYKERKRINEILKSKGKTYFDE